MKEREKSSGAVGCFIVGMFAFMLLPLYVLSVGPFVWIAADNPALEPLGYIYFPIGYLGSVCPPVDNVLNWYLELWTSDLVGN